ncbi:MAG: hypothetical protein IPH15_14915 [Comamonadaceae bacterium]|jgi:hypothetical protein|nr:hypothetical protein [Comamonadaceae bacterium]
MEFRLDGSRQPSPGPGEHASRGFTRPGTSLSIPLGTSFHFRATGSTPFAAVGVTMPPWPGMDEAEFVVGPWQAG